LSPESEFLKKGKGRSNETQTPDSSRGLERKAARRRMIKFLLMFLFFWVTFFFIAWKFTEQLQVLCPWTASQVSWTMRLLGVESSATGTLCTFGPRSVTIVMECTALQVAMIYTALILAYPSSVKAKLIGIGAGLPLIMIINIIRLVVICFVLWWKPEYFEMMHIYVWQVVFIVVVVAMAALWIEKVVHRERRSTVPG
jgi:archaeosortase B (VPXXXP-CTERM-specific)